MSKSKAERFRMMAAECERQAELAAAEEVEFREMQKHLANSFHALAETEDWLEGRPEKDRAEEAALGAEPREAHQAA